MKPTSKISCPSAVIVVIKLPTQPHRPMAAVTHAVTDDIIAAIEIKYLLSPRIDYPVDKSNGQTQKSKTDKITNRFSH